MNPPPATGLTVGRRMRPVYTSLKLAEVSSDTVMPMHAGRPGSLRASRRLGIDLFAGCSTAALGHSLMTYSYTQLAQYLACPLRYRYRHLDGWQERATRAGLLFGRAFEQVLAALFRREDHGCALFEALSQYKNASLEYPKNET